MEYSELLGDFFNYKSNRVGKLWTVSGILFMDSETSERPEVIATRGESGCIYLNENIKADASIKDFVDFLVDMFKDHQYISRENITASDEFLDDLIARPRKITLLSYLSEKHKLIRKE